MQICYVNQYSYLKLLFETKNTIQNTENVITKCKIILFLCNIKKMCLFFDFIHSRLC